MAKKYKKGALITSMDEIAQLITESKYMMIDNFAEVGWVPIHSSMITNMSFRTIWLMIGKGEGGRLAYAESNLKNTEGANDEE